MNRPLLAALSLALACVFALPACRGEQRNKGVTDPYVLPGNSGKKRSGIYDASGTSTPLRNPY